MDQNAFSMWVSKPMTSAEFSRFSEFIISHCGIKMPPSKKVMLEARLQKRLRSLGIRTYGQYFAYLQGDGGRDEIVQMLDAVTTNKTDFFREPVHFQFLEETVLPQFIETREQSNRRDKPFFIWSAGCSSGEEPYTLAMVMSEFAAGNPSFRFSLLATDISTKVLNRAQEAIYDADRVATVPLPMRQKYLLRSRERSKKLVRIVPALRAAVQFRRLNLMEEALTFSEPLDAIFCRNVIIYFDRMTQEHLIGRFCRVLRDGAYLFLGHSESVHGFDLPLKRITSTVYRKIGQG